MRLASSPPALGDEKRGPRHTRPGRVLAFVRRHWLFLVVLALGAGLRAVVQLTYQPAIFFADSFAYLDNVLDPRPDTQRPLGYPIVFLRPLLWAFHDLSVIPLTQHLLGLGMAVAIYVVLARYGAPRWLSALAVAPVLLDGYQLQIEEDIASDSFFQALVIAALVLLVWHRRPSPGVAATVGLLMGTAATVRFVGWPLLIVPLIYVLAMSIGWRGRLVGAGTCALAAALPMLIYSFWTYGETGEFHPGGGRTSGRVMQARVSPFADCRALAGEGAPNYVLRLCPDEPRSLRPQTPKYYMRQSLSGTPDLGLPPGVDLDTARREFAVRVVLNQPLDFSAAVLDDFTRGFAWKRTQQPGEWPLETWRFDAAVKPAKTDERWTVLREYEGGEPSVLHRPAVFLRHYQAVIYTRGPLFAAGLILPLLAVTGLGRARRSGLGAPVLLLAGTGAALLLSAACFAFSWRYQLPSIPLLPWSAALSLAGLFPSGAARTTKSTRHGTRNGSHRDDQPDTVRQRDAAHQRRVASGGVDE